MFVRCESWHSTAAPWILSPRPHRSRRTSSYSPGKREAETKSFVLSAERGSTKESSFPHPLAHPPLRGQKRLGKVIAGINMVEIASVGVDRRIYRMGHKKSFRRLKSASPPLSPPTVADSE